jgi:hypothetical protein
VVDYEVDISHHLEGVAVSILIASLTAPLVATVLAALFVAAMSSGFRVRPSAGQD